MSSATGPLAPGGNVRARIAAAARELFTAQGYERTTVETIAERAGVSRRTFFRHFPSKDDAIFPDHERIERAAAERLAALGDVPPVRPCPEASGCRLDPAVRLVSA